MASFDHSDFLCPPYNDGLLLAANAIRDIAIVMDSPNCAQRKIEGLHSNHDWRSTLGSQNEARLFHTNLQLATVALGRQSELGELLQGVDSMNRFSLILVAAAAMVAITGRSLDTLGGDVKKKIPTPIIDLMKGDLNRDWLEGYEDFLTALAKFFVSKIDSTKKPDNQKAAVIGYLFHRNEGDCLGDVAEIERLVRFAGFTPSSVWLSGNDLKESEAAMEAGVLVALPMGKNAAKTIAKATGAKIVEADIPVGYEASVRFIEALESTRERANPKRNQWRKAMEEALDALKLAVPRWLIDKRFLFAGDPFFALPFLETMEYFGAIPKTVVLTSKPLHVEESAFERFGAEVFIETRRLFIAQYMQKRFEEGELDFVIGSTVIAETAALFGIPNVELGYPSYFQHFMTPTPLLGMGGLGGIVERIANNTAK